MSFDDIFNFVVILFFFILFAYAGYRINKTDFSKDEI